MRRIADVDREWAEAAEVASPEGRPFYPLQGKLFHDCWRDEQAEGRLPCVADNVMIIGDFIDGLVMARDRGGAIDMVVPLRGDSMPASIASFVRSTGDDYLDWVDRATHPEAGLRCGNGDLDALVELVAAVRATSDSASATERPIGILGSFGAARARIWYRPRPWERAIGVWSTRDRRLLDFVCSRFEPTGHDLVMRGPWLRRSSSYEKVQAKASVEPRPAGSALLRAASRRDAVERLQAFLVAQDAPNRLRALVA